MILYLETGTFEVPESVIDRINPADVKDILDFKPEPLACICYAHKGER